MDNKKEQFSAVYDQYIEKIYRFVYAKVDSKETAEDITSKTFTKGWKAFQNSENNIENMSAFLYQIARNSIADYYREKTHYKAVSSDKSQEIVDDSVNIHNEAILSSDMDMVRSAIARLDKEYQDIIIWHYLNDMKISEIADLTNRPAGTIRVMLHRGLKNIKGLIEEA